jgi:xanthine dehydrogenase accessory factor
MRTTARSLLAFFRDRTGSGEPLVLATVIDTEGSTYRKPGAHMLIAQDGSSMGLLSGGCVESDLVERAARVLATNTAEVATYDARISDDPVWGLGLGCEGAMRILLQRLDAASGYRPFAYVAECITRHEPGALAVVVESQDARFPAGTSWDARSGDGSAPAAAIIECCRRHARGGGFEMLSLGTAGTVVTAFVTAVSLPARLLILGAGPDAVPVAEVAKLIGWQITVADHRAGYLDAGRFAEGTRLVELRPERLAATLGLGDFDAAVVMSHNLDHDAQYLRALAAAPIPYVGLLGPGARRQRLLAELGADAARLGQRLFGPVGLDIGARTPEAIALAIVAEIHAFLAGRHGESFRLAAGR